MPEIFINYRTGCGDKTANLLDETLRARFGDSRVFRDARSIRPAADFRSALETGVRRASCVLAVMGAGWQDVPQLAREDDWVRRELAEALTCGIPVLPVLDGRRTERLRPDALPSELRQLAYYQYLRIDNETIPTDLTRIGDELAALVPELREADESSRPEDRSEAGSGGNTTGDVHGTVTHQRDITLHGGTYVHSSEGPLHAGKGGQYTGGSRHFSGDIGSYVEGDNRDGIHHHAVDAAESHRARHPRQDESGR